MRIMIVNTYYYPEIVGGAEYSVKYLAETLLNKGHEIHVLCTGKGNITENINGVIVHRFKTKSICRALDAPDKSNIVKIVRRIQDIYNHKNGKLFKKIIRDISPDIIHTNGLYDISPVIWKVAEKMNIRIVHTLRDYFLVCPKVSLKCGHIKGKCENGMFPCRIHRYVNKINSKHVDCITAPSKLTMNIIKEYGLFRDTPHVVIENATDVDTTKINAILQNKKDAWKISPHKKIKFIFLGSLTEQKGVLWMLDSFKKIESCNVELFIAGKGLLEDVIKDAAINDTRIHYIGFLDEAGIDSVLSEMDILICPSLWEEPFGRVVLDAYKHAMPVICSNRGALPELVENNSTGTVVETDDIESLYNAMSFYTANKTAIIERAQNATICIKRFSLIKQADSFHELYSSFFSDNNA